MSTVKDIYIVTNITGQPVQCQDLKNKGKYLILEGNKKIELTDKKQAELFELIPNIKVTKKESDV